MFFLPALAVLVAGVLLVRERDRERDRQLTRQESRDLARLQAGLIATEVGTIRSTLLYLAGQDLLREFLRDRATRPRIEQEYVRFCSASQVFGQMRVIDLDRREILRVNHDGIATWALPEAELQSKADRYYVAETQRLAPGQVYVSPIDLNVELGRIEEPWNPVLRLGTPIVGDGGDVRGILVLNYLARGILDRLRGMSADPPGSAWLVNSLGFYLEGPTPKRSWGFMFDQDPTFAQDHPTAWEAIRRESEGTLLTPAGLYAYETVESLASAGGHRDRASGVKLICFVSTEELYAPSNLMFRRLAAGAVIAALLLLAGSVRLGYVSAFRDAHERELVASERRLRTLSALLLKGQELERARLARDLHDELGQIATAMSIDLQRAQRSAEPEQRDALVERTRLAVDELLSEMHRIATRIRTPLLDDLGLKAALRGLIEEFAWPSEVEVQLSLDFEDEGLDGRVGENAYRIVQEALTNVARHADARKVSVAVGCEDDQLRIRIRDDGLGFASDSTPADRLGVVGMRERAELLGGTCRIQSSPGDGTAVDVRMPLDPPSFET